MSRPIRIRNRVTRPLSVNIISNRECAAGHCLLVSARTGKIRVGTCLNLDKCNLDLKITSHERVLFANCFSF